MFSSNLKLKINPLMDKKIHGSSSGRDFRGSTISSVKCSLNNSEDLIVKVRERVKGKVEISTSAYDTAWVAMVPTREYSGGKPRFPECLDWIVENQNSDGSWGVQSLSMLKNTLSCTLACLLPLRKWNVASPQVFYCSYPSSNRSKSDWWAVCKTQARSIVQVPPHMTESSIPPPSQQDELVMVDSIVADEQIPNLSDGVVIEIVEDDDEEDEDEEFEFSDDSSSSHSDEEDI